MEINIKASLSNLEDDRTIVLNRKIKENKNTLDPSTNDSLISKSIDKQLHESAYSDSMIKKKYETNPNHFKNKTRQTTSPPRNIIYKSRFQSNDKFSKSDRKKKMANSRKKSSIWSESIPSDNWIGKNNIK